MPQLDLSFWSAETSFSVRRFAVKEASSTSFEVTVTVLSPRSNLGGASFVGRPSQLSAITVTATRVWNGLCRAMELDEIEEGGLSTDTLTIVPELRALTQRCGHRIFQHASIPEIADRLLGEW
jgi:type VI secretion system secreted protein VgrG